MTALAAPGAVIGAAVLGIAALGDLRQRLPAFLLLFALAFGAYLLATWRVLRSPQLVVGRRLWAVLGLALLFRLALVPVPATLSDDLYRYAWEGRLLAAGVSPYLAPPDAPVLAPFRDEAIWPRVNTRYSSSPYPPLAQVAGMLGALLTPGGTLGVKLVSTVADLGTVGALLLLLRATGGASGRVLVYAWHPLPLVAFPLSGHHDSLMVCLLTLGLALAAAGRRWTAALLIALAALSKVTPLVLLPLLPGALGWGPAVLAGAVFVLAYVPLLILGDGATGAVFAYLGTFKDNDSLHAVLHGLLGAPVAKALSLAILLAGVGLLALHPRLRRRPLWWRAYVAVALLLLVSASVHSWYLPWLLPPLALALVARPGAPWLGGPASLGWLLFTGLVVLPYVTYDTHWWSLWLNVVQYAPLYALLALAAAQTLRRLRPPAQAAGSAGSAGGAVSSPSQGSRSAGSAGSAGSA